MSESSRGIVGSIDKECKCSKALLNSCKEPLQAKITRNDCGCRDAVLAAWSAAGSGWNLAAAQALPVQRIKSSVISTQVNHILSSPFMKAFASSTVGILAEGALAGQTSRSVGDRIPVHVTSSFLRETGHAANLTDAGRASVFWASHGGNIGKLIKFCSETGIHVCSHDALAETQRLLCSATRQAEVPNAVCAEFLCSAVILMYWNWYAQSESVTASRSGQTQQQKKISSQQQSIDFDDLVLPWLCLTVCDKPALQLHSGLK